MSLNEILPAVRALPREEQVELVRVLSAELEGEPPPNDREAELLARLVAAAPYQLDRPEFGPNAAEDLQRLLITHRNRTD